MKNIFLILSFFTAKNSIFFRLFLVFFSFGFSCAISGIY